MNSYKFHGMTGYLVIQAIVTSLNVPFSGIYKAIKNIDIDGVITLSDGRKFKLELTQIIDN